MVKKDESYRTCDHARRNGNPVRRLVRQKYRTVINRMKSTFCHGKIYDMIKKMEIDGMNVNLNKEEWQWKQV